LQDAEEAKKDSFARLLEAEQKRLEAYQQAENIVESAKQESYFNYDTVIEQAKIDAKKISDAAHDDAQTLITRLQETEDKKVVELALYASEQLLKKKIDKKENEKFIKEFINSKGGLDD
jgi:F0F1-type ATP synthase membrane subunit b/b'